jgi:hypothetical protein
MKPIYPASNFHLFMNTSNIPTKRLITEEIMNGRTDPKLSHNMPVKTEPDITARLESIVKNPIADPLNSSFTRSETQALVTPSVEAAYIP